MRKQVKGSTLVDEELVVSAAVLDALEKTLDTSSAADTARLVPYFAAAIGGESVAVDGLGLDLSQALLAGIDYEWHRPLKPEETVRARVAIEDVYSKGANEFGVLTADFTDAAGVLVQRQTVTFIERGSK